MLIVIGLLELSYLHFHFVKEHQYPFNAYSLDFNDLSYVNRCFVPESLLEFLRIRSHNYLIES